MTKDCVILGLESSCDDTAAALIRVDGVSGRATILSHSIYTQKEEHAQFGGVVPEIAARAHVPRLDSCTRDALSQAQLTLANIDAIAVTSGPGLIGGVVSAVMFAKGLSRGANIPLIGVNHLAGHALTPRLTDGIAFPYLMLLVSGGHCQYLGVTGPNQFTRLGSTIDDSPGEAFDKVARLLGLPQPGGPHVEKWAEHGDAARFAFPRPLIHRDDCNLSFSGLKTAVLRARDSVMGANSTLKAQDVRDICAGFQAAVADIFRVKTERAINAFTSDHPTARHVCVAGGVAANTVLRAQLKAVCEKHSMEFNAPPLWLCTDNAAMIAYAGYERFAAGDRDDMSLAARPRWPLDDTQSSLVGHGKKGAKV